jgi:hypothetical protein
VGVHGVESFGQVTRSTVKQVFASSSAPERVAIKAMTRLRTQFDIPAKAAFLKNPSLHGAPHFLGIIVEGGERVIPQMRYFSRPDFRRNGRLGDLNRGP